ncbi:MAG: hypothetical protein J7J76_03675 [Candidatus Latescibacteria bacterium]|nr:hypothetical protein [Candidatus Latescibacterota bacterium]
MPGEANIGFRNRRFEYQGILERLEEGYDLKILEQMRKAPLKFKKSEDFPKDV